MWFFLGVGLIFLVVLGRGVVSPQRYGHSPPFWIHPPFVECISQVWSELKLSHTVVSIMLRIIMFQPGFKQCTVWCEQFSYDNGWIKILRGVLESFRHLKGRRWKNFWARRGGGGGVGARKICILQNQQGKGLLKNWTASEGGCFEFQYLHPPLSY